MVGFGIGFFELIILAIIGIPLLWWLFGGMMKGSGNLISNLNAGAVKLNCPQCGKETDSRRPACEHCGTELR